MKNIYYFDEVHPFSTQNQFFLLKGQNQALNTSKICKTWAFWGVPPIWHRAPHLARPLTFTALELMIATNAKMASNETILVSDFVSDQEIHRNHYNSLKKSLKFQHRRKPFVPQQETWLSKPKPPFHPWKTASLTFNRSCQLFLSNFLKGIYPKSLSTLFFSTLQ